jgi:uncharacterized membrane protein YozB (DUF420 family)
VQFYIDLHKCFVVMFYFAAIAAVGLIRLAVMKHGERWGPTSLIHVHLFLVALTIPALILTVVWNGVRRPKKHPKAVKAFLVLFVCVLVTGLWLRSYAPST